MIIKKAIKVFLVSGLFLFLVLVVLPIFYDYPQLILQLIYFIGFLYWAIIVAVFKIKVARSFKIAFGLFLISSFLYVLGLKSIGEELMRYSFIGWVVGFGQQMVISIKGR